MLTAGKARATKVNIRRKSLTADGQGGYTTSWSVLYRDVLCRFNAIPARDLALMMDKKAVYAEYNVYLEYRSGIQENDQLIRTDNSREYEIKFIQDWDEDQRMLKLGVTQIKRNA